ncbi:SDR family oxidoreductase [uncultured Tolumonas sp.]|uniref:SDR family oxidoreductase n=1 Tax=uncultured Tolumonas sp. TaxID=263765 RepID=UPI002A0A47F4|nr:SDR family oxidoreductase [uncultured Tolumonas sp.]
MTNKILVLGATGNIGKPLTEALVAKGEKVKAASRTGKAVAGAESVVFDFTDLSTIDNAFEGVDRVYVMVPTGHIDVVSLVTPVLDVAIKNGVKIVLQSVLGVDADDSIPYRQLELKVERSGVPFVILRPNWFSDNFHTFWLAGIKQGVIAVPAAQGKSSFIDVRDIAESAASALTTAKFDGNAFNLTGPEALSYADAAEKLSKASGHAIQYQAIDDDTFVGILTGVGVPKDYASFLASIFYPVREGWTALVTDSVEKLTGHAPRSVATYIDDHIELFK